MRGMFSSSSSNEASAETARLHNLELRANHTDTLVTDISKDVASMKSTMEAVKNSLESQAPSKMNGLTLAFGVIAATLAIVEYVNLRITPITDFQTALVGQLAGMREGEIDDAYDRGLSKGSLETKLKTVDFQLKHLESQFHVLDGRITSSEVAIASDAETVKLMLEYLRDIDEKGSRKWISKGGPTKGE